MELAAVAVGMIMTRVGFSDSTGIFPNSALYLITTLPSSIPSNLGIYTEDLRKQERAVRRGLRHRVHDVRLNLVENFDSIVDDEVVDHEVDNRCVDVDTVGRGRSDVVGRAEEGEGDMRCVVADAWAGL